MVIFRAHFFPFQRPKPKTIETMAKGVPNKNNTTPASHQSPNNQMLDRDIISNTEPYKTIKTDKMEIPVGFFLFNEL